MRKRLFTVLASLWLATLPYHSNADIGSDLGKVFQGLGSHTNASEGGTYSDQSAGYYSGGSLFVRNQNRNLQPATVQMPGFNAGCGGIDMHMGGFSFVDSKQLVEMLRNIGSKAQSYAFMLAVQSLTPQVYNVMNELNALAQEINQFNIGSCEAASTAVGAVWPKSDMASKHLCQSMGSNLGAVSDWTQGRHACGAKGDRSEILSRGDSDPKYKDILKDEYNLAWKAIQMDGFLASDKELASLFMTLSGTLISRKVTRDKATGGGGTGSPTGGYERITLPSLADQDALLTALLDGGKATVYLCDTTDEKCLRPNSKGTVTITPERAFRHKVHQTLSAMVEKIHDDTPLTLEEQGFLNATKLPIYKILNVLTAFRRGGAPVNIHEYDDMIALDIIHQYILEILTIVSQGLTNLREVQVDEGVIATLQQQLVAARKSIAERRHSAFERLDTALSLIQKTQLIEQQVHHMMGTVAAEERD